MFPKYSVCSLETSKINILQQPAIANLDAIWLDHSHYERKAAGVPVNLMFRYPSYHQLVPQLTAIAKEESKIGIILIYIFSFDFRQWLNAT
jgi:tRNA isopentenyl-2-thiomethyl-A-37 hydroxylase MiaE